MVQGSHKTPPGGTCNGCNMPQLARNHYFTGKLLVERDFTDEQQYHIGKQQRHNHALHGSGCVCGLKVKPHSNPACQDQYVVIEPGTALDCCGRELVVTREETFDFSARIAENNLQLGVDKHTLQICLRYAECPTEQIPVLFDDCGGDDTASQPNRIMESYSFDVRIAPIMKRRALDDVHLKWSKTFPVANASRIVVDEANGRFLVLTADTPAVLSAYRLSNNSLIGSKTLKTEATDIALSPDGTRVYVAVKQKKSVLVYDVAQLNKPGGPLNELPSTAVPQEGVRLAVSPRNGFLYVLDIAQKTVTPWDQRINSENDDVDDARHEPIRVGNAPRCIISSPEGNWIFVSNSADKTISAIDIASHGHVTLHLTNIVPGEMAAAATDDGLKLYIADATNNTVSILGLELRSDPPFTLLGKYTFAAKLVALTVSPGGRWLYGLLADGADKGRVQVIDAHSVERGEAYAAGDTLPVGTAPRQVVLVANRQHLYAVFQGTAAEADMGGVALIDALETTCEDLFKRALDDCQECDDDDDDGCIVLATIQGYTAGAKIVDGSIDNFTDRHLLPSTDLITDVVRCMLENGGGKGRRGEEGPQGKNGEGIDKVEFKTVACDQPGSASIHKDDEKRILRLEIPRGCDAPEPVKVEYTHICGMNWVHREKRRKDHVQEHGIVIAFSQPVHAIDINRHTFQVLVGHRIEEGLICWCELQGQVHGVQLDLEPGEEGTRKIVHVDEPHTHPTYETLANGAIFRPDELPFDPGTLRVILKGDLIRDEKGLGVDANHLPPWLPERVTGDGVQGGTFESWFIVERREEEEEEKEEKQQTRGTRRRTQAQR